MLVVVQNKANVDRKLRFAGGVESHAYVYAYLTKSG